VFYGSGRQIQNGCNFFNGQSAEVAELHNLSPSWIQRFEAIERVVQSDHFAGALFGDRESCFKLDAVQAATPHLRIMCSRVVDKHTTHHIRSYSNEMLAAPPVDVIVRQTKIGLVNGSRSLQGMVISLSLSLRIYDLATFRRKMGR